MGIPATPAPTRPAAPPPPASDPATVRARGQITDDGFLGTARNDHLHTLKNDLQSAPGAQVNTVLNGLSPDELRNLGQDLNSSGVFGAQGLSDREKTELFDNLAGKAGGAELARLSNGLDRPDKLLLAQSVARAPDATKVDYVRALAPATTRPETQISTGFGSSSSTSGSTEAAAVGTVLASTRGAAADQAFGVLNRDQLAAVARTAENQRTTTTATMGGGSVSTSYDTRPLAALMDAAASGADPGIKARMFEAGGDAIGRINAGNTLLSPNPGASGDKQALTRAMTGLLNSDATGVVQALATDQVSGRALAAYSKEMVHDGRTADLGQIMGKLQHGNNGQQPDAAQFIAEQATNSQGQPYYRNAQNLGYFSGAVQAGINSITSDQKKQAELIGNVFTSAIFAGAVFVPPAATAARVAVPLVNGLTRQAITDVTNSVAAGNKSARDAFNELSLPRIGNTGERYRGPAEADFLSYQNTVMLQNQ